MHPGIDLLGSGADFSYGIAGAGGNVTDLGADDGGTIGIRQELGTHPALGVRRQALDSIAAQSQEAERLEDTGVHLLTDHDRNRRRSKQSLAFHVPSFPLKQRMPRRGQGGEIGHGGPSDKAYPRAGR